jgi:ABC-2 type transport system permease protein
MRYLIEILRGVLLKGVGFEILWPQCVCLLVLGLLSSSLAVARFRKIAS